MSFKPSSAKAANWWLSSKEGRQKFPNKWAYRVLTDASGPFYTVVAETEVASLADWEKRIADIFASPDFGQWFERVHPLVESGRGEFYNIE